MADKSLTISRSYHPHYDEVVLKARQACDFFLISGPPGTGKTSLAMRFIVEEELATGTDYFGQPSSVLLAAYTNRAVDEICQMLDNAGIDFVRIGNEYATDSRYRQYLAEKVLGGCRSLADAKAVMSSKRVVVGTTSSLVAHPWLFGIKHFALAIIDEASQLLEPAVVGLLCSHQSGTDDIDRFILIGDHKQLPAVVAQTAEESAVSDDSLHAIGLQDCRESLFERLLRMEHARGTDAQVAILHRHGRMHPDIARWPNSKFYLREQLVAVPLPHQQEDIIAPLLPDSDAMDTALARQRTLFIASPMPDNCGQSTKVNLPEAQLVADIAHRIYDRYGETFQPERTLGIIVPYRNQISAIRKALAACHIAALDHISIDTVERYQGSQREVIIYSLTVSRRSQLDFLTANTFVEDGQLIDRKLNVALTRARRQLILVGNREVLSLDPLLRDFIDEYAIDEFLPQNP